MRELTKDNYVWMYVFRILARCCSKVEDQFLESQESPGFSLVNIISADEIDFEDRQVVARLKHMLNHGTGKSTRLGQIPSRKVRKARSQSHKGQRS